MKKPIKYFILGVAIALLLGFISGSFNSIGSIFGNDNDSNAESDISSSDSEIAVPGTGTGTVASNRTVVNIYKPDGSVVTKSTTLDQPTIISQNPGGLADIYFCNEIVLSLPYNIIGLSLMNDGNVDSSTGDLFVGSGLYLQKGGVYNFYIIVSDTSSSLIMCRNDCGMTLDSNMYCIACGVTWYQCSIDAAHWYTTSDGFCFICGPIDNPTADGLPCPFGCGSSLDGNLNCSFHGQLYRCELNSEHWYTTSDGFCLACGHPSTWETCPFDSSHYLDQSLYCFSCDQQFIKCSNNHFYTPGDGSCVICGSNGNNSSGGENYHTGPCGHLIDESNYCPTCPTTWYQCSKDPAHWYNAGDGCCIICGP